MNTGLLHHQVIDSTQVGVSIIKNSLFKRVLLGRQRYGSSGGPVPSGCVASDWRSRTRASGASAHPSSPINLKQHHPPAVARDFSSSTTDFQIRQSLLPFLCCQSEWCMLASTASTLRSCGRPDIRSASVWTQGITHLK